MGGPGGYTDMDLEAQRQSNLARVTGWATGPRTKHYLPSSRLSQEEEMATHSSILAQRVPWTEEPGRLQSIGSHRDRHDLNDLAWYGIPNVHPEIVSGNI